MPQYLALTYTADVDWWAPEQADELAENAAALCFAGSSDTRRGP